MADNDKTKPRVRIRRRPHQTGGRPAEATADNAENRDAEPDYEVGYGKPPKATQFKKGQSGNPKGRPALARNYRSIVNQELNAPPVCSPRRSRIEAPDPAHPCPQALRKGPQW